MIEFEKRGDNFTLDVPHKNIWYGLIRFLKRRGFLLTENTYFKTLSKFHKIGSKKDVRCLIEIGSWFIKIDFGSVKNIWAEMPMTFWDDPRDNRYTQLSYLEDKCIELEIFKALQYLNKYASCFENKCVQLNPEEYIIDNLRINQHIHGKVSCLNDIAIDMQKDNYNSKTNSTDANGKKILCGEVKYYYDPITNRLSCGVVWHNINNMWWVISGNVLRNIPMWGLFDYSPTLTRRKPVSVEKLENVLKKFEQKRDYKRCLSINTIINQYKQVV